MRRSIARLSIPFREPYVTSAGVVSARELILLRLEDEAGLIGYGEAAPLESYDGWSSAAVTEALAAGPSPGAPPQATAAEEMARLDLRGQRTGQGLGEPGADAIPVNCTLAGGPPDEVARRAADGVRAGFSCFKLKVGLADDLARVEAVRAAVGPWPALRLDANGAWSIEDAVAVIGQLACFDLQLVEQPCRTLEQLAEVRREVSVPIAADESIATAQDVRTAVALEACDIVNVKLAPSGGFHAAREVLREASSNGLGTYISSTLDGPWGISAALQLAASERLSLQCGLATLDLFDAGVARTLPPPADGLMAVPQGPGLGVSIAPEDLAEVLVGGFTG